MRSCHSRSPHHPLLYFFILSSSACPESWGNMIYVNAPSMAEHLQLLFLNTLNNHVSLHWPPSTAIQILTNVESSIIHEYKGIYNAIWQWSFGKPISVSSPKGSMISLAKDFITFMIPGMNSFLCRRPQTTIKRVGRCPHKQWCHYAAVGTSCLVAYCLTPLMSFLCQRSAKHFLAL